MTDRDSHTKPQRRTGNRGKAIPWAISIAAHAALIIGAFFIVWRVTAPDEPPPRKVTISFESPALASTPPVTETNAEAPPNRETPHHNPKPLRFDEALRAMNVTGEKPPPSLYTDQPPHQAPPDIEEEPPPPVSFAGVGASDARDVVYVVDASGSMITTMPEVRLELARSINALDPLQRFCVLLIQHVNGSSHLWRPSPNSAQPTLLDATHRNKLDVLTWVQSVTPAGTSDPLGALEAALAMKPDAIFLLSTSLAGVDADDVNPRRLLARLDALNPVDRRNGRRPVTIKTIQILDEDPSGVLRAIGLAHGGPHGYNFISRDDFNRHKVVGPAR